MNKESFLNEYFHVICSKKKDEKLLIMSEKNDALINEINVAAYYIAEGKNPYDTLCWHLAERQLTYDNLGMTPPQEVIKQKAAQIYFEQCPYDILCWRIAELETLMKYNMYKTE